jgi:hypothetical protein
MEWLMNDAMEKDLEGSGRGIIEVLSQNLLGETKENHENPSLKITCVLTIM